MKLRLLAALVLSWGLLTANPERQKQIVKCMEGVNRALTDALGYSLNSRRQDQSIEIAKGHLIEALFLNKIDDCYQIYAIAGILFGDPVYTARAVVLAKQEKRKDTVTLERKARRDEESAESQLEFVEERIKSLTTLLEQGELHVNELMDYESHIEHLKKTKRWLEAQCIAHGMLRKCVERYKDTKGEEL